MIKGFFDDVVICLDGFIIFSLGADFFSYDRGPCFLALSAAAARFASPRFP
jgi:hypothetical protein